MTELAGTFAAASVSGGSAQIELALLVVRPAETVQERGVPRLHLQRALHEVDGFIEPLTVIGQQVAE